MNDEALRMLADMVRTGGGRTQTVSVTKTELTTTTATVVCASFINVTDSCNSRNGRWLRIPQVLSFEEDMEVVDRYINPSQPYRIIPTVMPDQYAQSPVILEPTEEYSPSTYNQGVIPRFFFSQFFTARPVVTVTREFTKLVTETSNVYKTFFISGCTPSPFPFQAC